MVFIDGGYFEVVPGEGGEVEFGLGLNLGEDDFLEVH